MRSRKKCLSPVKKRTNTFKWTRIPLFSLIFAAYVGAAVLSGLLPSDNFSASAQRRTGNGKNVNATELNRPDTEAISESVRQQIAALVQEKMNRSAARSHQS
jgi:hypothetical protein